MRALGHEFAVHSELLRSQPLACRDPAHKAATDSSLVAAPPYTLLQ